MSILLKIYFAGSLLTIAYCIFIMSEKNRVDAVELICSIIMGVFSWLGFFALWVGQHIKSE